MHFPVYFPDIFTFVRLSNISMQLIEVKDKKSIREFHRVPYIIYKNDKNWIPHLTQDVEKLFNPEKNKAFRGGAAIRWVLKNDQGELIGRVAAFVHKKYSGGFEYPVGGMGYFECINDKKAAFLMFDACKQWLTDKGMKAMDGPINFGEKSEYWGLLVQNFDYPPTYQVNYNPAYYREFFEAYGFQVFYEQYIFWRDLVRTADEVFMRKTQLLWNDPKFELRDVRGMSDEQLARYFIEIYNDAWGSHEGFASMKFEQALKIMKAIKPVKDPRITVFAFYDKQPVAFYINLPELNQIFRHLNGNLNLWGKLKFLYYKKFAGSTTMYGVVFGVVKDFQGRGVEASMIRWAGEIIVPEGKYKDTILTWIGDFNVKMLKVCKNLDASLLRTLYTYRVMFDENIPFKRAPFIGGDAEDVRNIIDNLRPLDANMERFYKMRK